MAQQYDPDEVSDAVLFARPRGRRKDINVEPLGLEVVRELVPGDLEALSQPSPKPGVRPIQAIKHRHHQLARHVALGIDDIKASFLVGYTPEYVRLLKKDPAFQELLKHYSDERDVVFFDTAMHMREIGVTALNEIQRRVEEDPDQWARRELMELAELMLIKSRADATLGNGQGNSPATPAINVTFVNANNAPQQAPSITLDQGPVPSVPGVSHHD